MAIRAGGLCPLSGMVRLGFVRCSTRIRRDDTMLGMNARLLDGTSISQSVLDLSEYKIGVKITGNSHRSHSLLSII